MQLLTLNDALKLSSSETIPSPKVWHRADKISECFFLEEFGDIIATATAWYPSDCSDTGCIGFVRCGDLAFGKEAEAVTKVILAAIYWLKGKNTKTIYAPVDRHIAYQQTRVVQHGASTQQTPLNPVPDYLLAYLLGNLGFHADFPHYAEIYARQYLTSALPHLKRSYELAHRANLKVVGIDKLPQDRETLCRMLFDMTRKMHPLLPMLDEIEFDAFKKTLSLEDHHQHRSLFKLLLDANNNPLGYLDAVADQKHVIVKSAAIGLNTHAIVSLDEKTMLQALQYATFENAARLGITLSHGCHSHLLWTLTI
jgi:hypothetical protein